MHIETVHGRRKQSMREAAEGNEDIAPVLQLCGAAMSAAQEIRVANASILNLVRELGGDSRRYVDERREEIMNLVSEIYSQPRVTRAAKLLPRLGLLP